MTKTSTQRVNKHREKEKKLSEFNDLYGGSVSETLLKQVETLLSVSVSVSLEILNELIVKKIDLDVWTDFERYRNDKNKPGKPLTTDKGRRRNMNVLAGKPPNIQREIFAKTEHEEWVGLFEPYAGKKKTPCIFRYPVITTAGDRFFVLDHVIPIVSSTERVFGFRGFLHPELKYSFKDNSRVYSNDLLQ